MKPRTLSVCMIVKNGEKRIGACLESVKGIADEIIVVDTGSTDGTVALAKKMGAKVIETVWEDNFSKARNISLSHATKNWILVLDDDERLEPDAANQIKALIAKKATHQGYYLRLVNIVDGVEVANSVVLRLFRNHPKHRFSGKIHEQIVNNIQAVHGNNCIGKASIRILHHGYDPNVSDIQAKSDRNLKLLLESDEKKDGYYYYVLANEYIRLDQYEEALAIYDKALEITDYSTYQYIYFPYLVINMVKIYCKIGNYQKAIEVAKQYLPYTPGFKDLYFMLVIAYTECSKFTEAKEALLNYMNCPEGNYEYPVNNFEQANDINDLLNRLVTGAIKKDPMLLDVYIEGNEEKDVIETIKSICEIANQVYVSMPCENQREQIKAIGAVPLDQRIEDIVLSEQKTKYILHLKAGEICSFVGEQRLADALEEVEADRLSLEIQKVGQMETHEEVRLFKKDKGYQMLEDYKRAQEMGEGIEESLGIRIYER